MKGKLVLSAIIILFMNPINVFSNGGGTPPYYFSELYFENDFWVLELFTFEFEDLDGWYLSTSTDTVYFMDGINPTEDYILITPGYGYLESSISINKEGDWLSLYNSDNEKVDELIYGNMYNAIISAPLTGQSICVLAGFGFIHYLDNTPTLGQPNDFEDAYGTIEGNVLDVSGNPLSNIDVTYYWSTVQTDSNGYFSFYEIAVLAELQVAYNGMVLDHFNIQAYPDSMITLVIDIQEPLITEEHEIDFNYQLSQNFPNPFNPTTTIKYQIPKQSFVALKIYDMLGNEITALVNEEKNAGNYEVDFNALRLPSGIYFCQLRTGDFVQTKKMVLLK